MRTTKTLLTIGGVVIAVLSFWVGRITGEGPSSANLRDSTDASGAILAGQLALDYLSAEQDYIMAFVESALQNEYDFETAKLTGPPAYVDSSGGTAARTLDGFLEAMSPHSDADQAELNRLRNHEHLVWLLPLSQTVSGPEEFVALYWTDTGPAASELEMSLRMDR